MFLVKTKAIMVTALREVFDASFRLRDFSNLNIQIEYPVTAADYPGIWVDFEAVGTVTKGGIDESFARTLLNPGNNTYSNLSLWRFQGYTSFTVFALHNLERDRLFDELVHVFAYSDLDESVKGFRRLVEDNPEIALNMDFDNVAVSGAAATVGTPWGSNDVVYEVTVRVDTLGEFVSDEVGQPLSILGGIEVFEHASGSSAVEEVDVGSIPGGTPSPSPDAWL